MASFNVVLIELSIGWMDRPCTTLLPSPASPADEHRRAPKLHMQPDQKELGGASSKPVLIALPIGRMEADLCAH